MPREKGHDDKPNETRLETHSKSGDENCHRPNLTVASTARLALPLHIDFGRGERSWKQSRTDRTVREVPQSKADTPSTIVGRAW